ncbi:MAG: site-specific integrase [Candidatus Rokubacteria bacterium]|nr:site-specific integrase [Candidatus Rokubacteria bacterium]
MTNQFFADPLTQHRRCAGPLGSYLEGFGALLGARGYARATEQLAVRVVVDFSRWLDRQQLQIADIDERLEHEFLRARRRRRRAHRSDRPTLSKLLEHLRHIGVIPAPTPTGESTELSRVERTYGVYLAQERGLSRATVTNYRQEVRRFLVWRFAVGAIRLDEIRLTDVTRFVSRHAHGFSPGRVKLMLTALRSFFRFLRLRGETTVDLASSVLSVADWRRARVPQWIPAAQVKRILRHCDQQSRVGQRDYTIVLLLARLGLRAGEVVGMTLDDIDWEAGELMVRGKGGRHDRMPLPRDVGEALATYVRHGRPSCASRQVFICAKAPRRGFTGSQAVCTIVRRALTRAGLHPPSHGAHLLRHSLATEMLRRGASLAEIGEILRHRHPDTTAIYAKVDLKALRAVAPPWPGNAA